MKSGQGSARSEKPPLKLEKISVEFVLESKDAEEKDLGERSSLRRESVCPVWQLIKNNVDVVPEYRVIKWPEKRRPEQGMIISGF